MFNYTVNTPWAVLERTAAELQKKIADIEDEHTDEAGEIVGLKETKKGQHTRANNELAKVLALMQQKEANTTAVGNSQQNQASSTSGQGEQKPRVDTESIRAMRADVNTQPELSAALDVAIFTRRMRVCYQTHVKSNPAIEADFVKSVECRLSPEYRHLYQSWAHSEDTLPKYSQMEEWLLNTFRSRTTIFQEMDAFLNMTIKSGESMRAFAARVKTRGAEAAVIIRSKYKHENKSELTEADLFELLYAHSFISTIQADSNHRRFYDRVVGEIDTCKTVEEVAAKASLYADREVGGDSSAPSNSALAIKNAEIANEFKQLKVEVKQLRQQNGAYMAGANKQSMEADKPKPGMNRKRPDFNDPVYREKVKDEQCKKEIRMGVCDRPVCPFMHKKPRKPAGPKRDTEAYMQFSLSDVGGN